MKPLWIKKIFLTPYFKDLLSMVYCIEREYVLLEDKNYTELEKED